MPNPVKSNQVYSCGTFQIWLVVPYAGLKQQISEEAPTPPHTVYATRNTHKCTITHIHMHTSPDAHTHTDPTYILAIPRPGLCSNSLF